MNRIIIILIIFSSALNTHAQQKSIETDIAAIRAAFKKINALSLKPEQFRYESEGCVEDGIVQYYFQDNKIVKIIESGSIGDGSWKNEYYYVGGKFIFSYELIVGSSADGQESKIEHRLYAKDGAAIRYMENQKILAADSNISKTMKIAEKLPEVYTTKKFAELLCK